MIFNSWETILRVLVTGTLAYVALVLLLRVSGKRTLSKMNAFDLIVTIALGSTLATILLNKDVALADGVTAFALLIFLQFLITWSAARSTKVEGWIKSKPTMLYFKGEYFSKELRRQRVTETEIKAAVREQGLATMEDAGAVILETDGSLTVLKKDFQPNWTAMDPVARPD